MHLLATKLHMGKGSSSRARISEDLCANLKRNAPFIRNERQPLTAVSELHGNSLATTRFI